MAQLMPLPLTVCCFSKIEIGFTFLVLAYSDSPGKGRLNVCVCVCVCLLFKGAISAPKAARLLYAPKAGGAGAAWCASCAGGSWSKRGDRAGAGGGGGGWVHCPGSWWPAAALDWSTDGAAAGGTACISTAGG